MRRLQTKDTCFPAFMKLKVMFRKAFAEVREWKACSRGMAACK